MTCNTNTNTTTTTTTTNNNNNNNMHIYRVPCVQATGVAHKGCLQRRGRGGQLRCGQMRTRGLIACNIDDDDDARWVGLQRWCHSRPKATTDVLV